MCALTMPGITYLPVASITASDAAATAGAESDDPVMDDDQPVLYDDVHRSVRRLGVAVDDHGIPDDETTRRSA